MHPRTMQTLGGILSGTGLFLILAFAGFLLIQWSTGALTPGGLGIGVFLILLIFSPLVGLGLYLWRRGAVEAQEAEVAEKQRRLLGMIQARGRSRSPRSPWSSGRRGIRCGRGSTIWCTWACSPVT
jgi:hypothetical protein